MQTPSTIRSMAAWPINRSRLHQAVAMLGALVALTGCATTANYDKQLNAMLGVSEAYLVKQWGRPTRIYEVHDKRYLVYTDSQVLNLSGSQAVITSANRYDGRPDQNVGLSCETTFEFEQGELLTWRHTGNHCKAGNQTDRP